MKYSVMSAGIRDGYAIVRVLAGGLDDNDDIANGVPALARFRDDAFFQIPAEYKKLQKLGDAVPAYTHLVVSARLKEAIAALVGGSKVEFLPVRIKDIAGTLVDGQYFIVHPLGTLDVIDVAASRGKFNSLAPDTLLSVKKLVLQPADAEIFRPTHWSRHILVREDLVGKLENAGFGGLEFVEAEDFRG